MVDLEKEIIKEEKKIEKAFEKHHIWMIISGVLAIVIILMLILSHSGNLSGKAASDKIVSFYGSQGLDIIIDNYTLVSGIYEINAHTSDGRSGQAFITKDGKYLVLGMQEMPSLSDSSSNTDTSPSVNIPKTDKPSIELFIMSYCPFGTQNQKGLIPVMNLLKDKIDAQVKFVNYTMHGQKETDENIRQYCIEKEQSSKFVPYLTCFLNASDSPGCLIKTGIDNAKLTVCFNSAMAQFTKSNSVEFTANNADNIKYGVGGSPTLIINGVQVSARSPAAILSYVCSAFNNAPSECSQELDSAMPSPGFGYSASSSDSAASCG